MMIEIEDNVRQDIAKLVPSSIINEITCFAFYDDHPRDDFKLDIIVCTKNCELSEYSNRELVLNTRVALTSKPRDIKILRNSYSKLFYLVSSQSEVIIFSRRQNLQIHKVVNNVDRYEIVDSLCNGQTNLKIFNAGDAVPLVFNENFEILDSSIPPDSPTSDSLPIIMQLKRKLIEAQYTVQCNEKAYEDLLKLRQIAVATIAQRNNPNSNENLIRQTSKISGGVIIQKRWIAFCNKKIAIASEVSNKFNSIIENVHILLDTRLCNLTYTTKLFEKVHIAPFWKEKQKNSIESQSSVYLLLVLNMKELSDSVTSQIIFEGVVTYESEGKSFVVPFEKVEITASDLMGLKLDVLSNVDEQDRDKLILTLLATSKKTNLCLRHIKSDDETISSLPSVLIQYLHMEKLKDLRNMIIHKKMPHHVLYGVLLVLENGTKNHVHNITVYSRSQKQVLQLIHYIHGAIPFRMIATTPQYQLVSKIPTLEHFTEDTNITKQKSNLAIYGQSVINQSAKILQYFDECMIKMNESKNAVIKSKIGKEIDLCASGKECFDVFREKITEEIDKSVEQLLCKTEIVFEDDVMIIDD